MEHLIVSRLAQHINPFWILGWKDEPPSYYEVMGHAQFEHISMKERYPKDNSLIGPFEYDYGRIAYFLAEIAYGEGLRPIEIDNMCDSGNIYAVAVILDGCHRLAAVILAKQTLIAATYGGRIDLLEWLTGGREACPQD